MNSLHHVLTSLAAADALCRWDQTESRQDLGQILTLLNEGRNENHLP